MYNSSIEREKGREENAYFESNWGSLTVKKNIFSYPCGHNMFMVACPPGLRVASCTAWCVVRGAHIGRASVELSLEAESHAQGGLLVPRAFAEQGMGGRQSAQGVLQVNQATCKPAFVVLYTAAV